VIARPGPRQRRRARTDGLPRPAWVLAGIAFTVAIGFGVVAPAIPVFAREFGVGRAAAGAVVSAFAFMRLASALLGGRLADRLGERRVLSAGVGIVAVSSGLAGLAGSYVQLLVLRGLGGVGSAMFTVSAIGLLLRVVGPDQRARAMGLWQGGFLLGGIAGPALGGLLTAWSLRAPFFVYAVVSGIAGLIGLAALPRAAGGGRSGEGADVEAPRMRIRDAWRHSGYRAALITNVGTGWNLFGVRNSLVPLFVAEALLASSAWTGIGFFVSAATQGLLLAPAGRFADRVGRRPAMMTGSLVAAVGIGLLAVLETLPGYLTAMGVFGAGAAFLSVAPSAAVGDVVRGRGGAVVATFQMAGDFGAVLGPIIAGMIVDGASYRAAFAVSAVVLAAGFVASLASRETRRAPTPLAGQAPPPAGGSAPLPPPGRSAEGGGQVGEQVRGMLEAD
jgi:MFS family permease